MLKLTKIAQISKFTSIIRPFLPAFQDPITKTTSNLGLKLIKTSEIRIYFEKIETW